MSLAFFCGTPNKFGKDYITDLRDEPTMYVDSFLADDLNAFYAWFDTKRTSISLPLSKIAELALAQLRTAALGSLSQSEMFILL